MLRYALCFIPLLAGCAMTEGDSAPAASAHASLAPEQAVAARRAGMRANAASLRAVKTAAREGTDVALQVAPAEVMARFAAEIPHLFPAGSFAGTGAKPEIAANRADFNRIAAELGSAAGRLAERARAGDKAGFAAQADAVGRTCGACHDAYQVPQQPK